MNVLKKSRVALLSAALSALVMVSTPAVDARSNSGIEQLARRLKSSDFRVQVQAALILGKSGDGRALGALSRALKDKSVAVRAAAAAALGTLGDPAALPALSRASKDSNGAVRRRVKATIASLKKEQRFQVKARRNAKVLVKIGTFKSRAHGDSSEALGAAAQASRKAISRMSQVAVLNASEDPKAAAKKHGRPVVMMRASLRHLSAARQGQNTVVSAKVEFVVEKYPEHSIMGRLSGNATAQSEVDSRRARLRLQEEAVDAAVKSALRKSESALLAAARAG